MHTNQTIKRKTFEHRRSGFTLIELMVVLVLVAIISMARVAMLELRVQQRVLSGERIQEQLDTYSAANLTKEN